MKLTLYNAVSIDGFIAKLDGDSDWVSESDAEIFESTCQKAGCIVMGKTTFEQFKGSLYPMKGVQNIVMSASSNHALTGGVEFANSPRAALEIAETEKDYTKKLELVESKQMPEGLVQLKYLVKK